MPTIETEEGSVVVKILPATITIGLAASVMDVFVPDLSLGFATETATPLMFATDPELVGPLAVSLPNDIVAGFELVRGPSRFVVGNVPVFGGGEVSKSDFWGLPSLPAG